MLQLQQHCVQRFGTVGKVYISQNSLNRLSRNPINILNFLIRYQDIKSNHVFIILISVAFSCNQLGRNQSLNLVKADSAMLHH